MANFKIIDEDYFCKLDKNIVYELVNNFGFNKELSFSNNEYSKYLQNYIIVTSFLTDNMDLENIYVNRYYWLRKFYHFYTLTNKKDIGIEQQISKILEEISSNVKNFDWNIILEIDQCINKN